MEQLLSSKMSRDIQSSPYIVQPESVASVSSAGKRWDGRGVEELRPFFFRTKVVSQASGSAYAEFHNTKVMVGVYGPRQPTRNVGFNEQGIVNCDVKLATFATRARGKIGQSADEKALSTALFQLLEPSVLTETFPKSQVDVFVTILESATGGAGDLSVIAACASLALADAGVQLRDLVSCCAVSKVQGHLVLDPSGPEAPPQHRDASLQLALMASLGRVVQAGFQGAWEPAEMERAMSLGLDGCLKIDQAMRQVARAGFE